MSLMWTFFKYKVKSHKWCNRFFFIKSWGDICCGNDEWRMLIKLHFNSFSYACNYMKYISILICICILTHIYLDKNKFSHDSGHIAATLFIIALLCVCLSLNIECDDNWQNSRKSINVPVTHQCVLWRTIRS